MSYRIRFTQPFVTGDELEHLAKVLASGESSGDAKFGRRCQGFIEERFGPAKVLLTTSCTSALEMAALLCNLERGDEVILPSYTFVSTANAFLLRGATLKFVDVRADTLNMDEQLVAAAVTSNTKAIVPVHYAGVGCEMNVIREIADANNLFVIEDAAQAVNATYNGDYLGTFGQLGAYSFHATKNVSCGEGGALLINDVRFAERAEIIREKGTDRARFHRGQTDKYTWVDIGSSYVLSDFLAAILWTQLQHLDDIAMHRKRIYDHYLQSLQPLAACGLLTLPTVPPDCGINHHIFFVLTESLNVRTALIEHLSNAGILAVFHYVPLHTSPMGASIGYQAGMLPVTESVSERLLRLPLFPALTTDQVEEVVGEIFSFFRVQRTD